ncbi:hypothetical protein AURDEDRAFT_124161 [Auricularia subglabra TFB-10046 SS5]|nr:hypothetical protein AURDEDRAFT_124161 [Auricularia subglabra TFB-10046 SS5]
MRSRAAESGLATDSTIAAVEVTAPDVTGLRPTPASRAPKRAASVADLRVETTKRGRITTETASGAPVSNPTNTNTAGSPTAAAPTTVSIITATAPAVADTTQCALDGPVEGSNTGNHDNPAADGAPAAGNGSATAIAAAGRPGAAAGVHPGSSSAHTAAVGRDEAPLATPAAAPAAGLGARTSIATSFTAPAFPASASVDTASASGAPPTDEPSQVHARPFASAARYAAAVLCLRLAHVARLPDVSRPPATAPMYLPRKPNELVPHPRALDGEATGQLAYMDIDHEYDHEAVAARAETDPNARWPRGSFCPPPGYTPVSSLPEYVLPPSPRTEDEEDGSGYCDCDDCVSRGGSDCAYCHDDGYISCIGEDCPYCGSDDYIPCIGEDCVHCSWGDGLRCVCDEYVYGPHASDDEPIYCTCEDCVSSRGSDCAYCHDDDCVSCDGRDCVYCGSSDWIPRDGEDCICCSCDNGAPCDCDDCVYGVRCSCDDCVFGVHASYCVNKEDLESEEEELELESEDEALESEEEDEEPMPPMPMKDQDALDRQATVTMGKIAATVQNIIEDWQGRGWNNGHLLERGDGNDADIDSENVDADIDEVDNVDDDVSDVNDDVSDADDV